jgi:DNA-binding PadR family transcriptional regulator
MDRSRTWRHGYDLSKETGLRSGTLYPLLMRLSEQGLLESRWQEPERSGLPPRHVYRLTASGLALAREQELAANGHTGDRMPSAGCVVAIEESVTTITSAEAVCRHPHQTSRCERMSSNTPC